MKWFAVGLLSLCIIGSAYAGEIESGDKEVSVDFQYSDIDFGTVNGTDLGGVEETNFTGGFGWFMAENHEIGVTFTYTKLEISGSDLFASGSTDGTGFGAFYAFHFTTGGIATPYVGVQGQILGGDLGDAYDAQYGVEAGLKIYPFEHAGLRGAVSYSEFAAGEDFLPDADGIAIEFGLLLKY